MSPTLRAHFADYAAFHGTPGNKACHYVGIPLIVLALLALLARVPLFAVGGFTVTLAEVALVAVTAYYLTLDAILAAIMLAASVGLLLLGRPLRSQRVKAEEWSSQEGWAQWIRELFREIRRNDPPFAVAAFRIVGDPGPARS